MSGFKLMESTYINWRVRRDLPTMQVTTQDNTPADEEAADAIEDQAGTTPGRRQGKCGRRHSRSRGKNRSLQETNPAGQNRPQDTTEALITTPAEREAAAIRFWTNTTPATIFGFSSNAETLAANLAGETRNRSTAELFVHTDLFQEVHRPVEQGESPFNPDVSSTRSVAILGGFVESRKNVGKKQKDWVGEKYIFAEEDDEPAVKDDDRKTSDHQPLEGQTQDQKELTPNGMKKWEWYGKRLRKDGARDAKRAAKRAAKREVAERGDIPSCRGNFLGNASEQRPPGHIGASSAGYDHGGFQDTNEFYAEPAPQLKKFNPEAMVFEPGGNPAGRWDFSTRKGELDDKMGGGLGALKQAIFEGWR